jgi:hypothetical protein
LVAVEGISKREGTFEVFNFEVEDFHTYFVSQDGVLVHNANCPINPPPNLPGPISMDDAVSLGVKHVGDDGRIVISSSGGYQFINNGVDAQGNNITRIARFDINLNSPHVQQYGQHLNLETQVNGKPVRKGSLADPHIPINPSTIRPSDIP